MVFLPIIMNCLFAAMFIVTTYALVPGITFEFWRIPVLFALPVCFYISRIKIKKPGLFVIAHIIPIGVSVYIMMLKMMSWPEWVCFGAIMLGFTVLSFATKKNSETGEENPVNPVGMLIFAFALILLIERMAGESRTSGIYYCLIIYAILYLVYFFFGNYYRFVMLNRIGQTRVGEKRLLKAGYPIAVGYSLFVGLMLLIASGTSFMNDVAGSVGRWLRNLLAFLISRLSSGSAAKTAETAEESVAAPISMPDISNNNENAILAIFWRALEKAVTIAFFIGVTALVIMLVRILIKRFRDLFARKAGVKEELTDLMVREYSETIGSRHRSKESRSVFSDLSTEARIRRIYAKLIKSKRIIIEKKTGQELGCLTADECSRTAFLPDDSDMLTTIYDFARYGAKPCTKDELAGIRKLAASVRKQ